MTRPRLYAYVPDSTKLLIGRYEPEQWWWAIVQPNGYVLDDGLECTHGQALVVGLAALEATLAEEAA